VAAHAPAERIGELQEFVQRYLAAWNEGDERALGALVTEDVVWADPALSRPAQGVHEVQAFMRASRVTFPDLRFSETEPPHVSLAGERVAWAWTMHGTMRGPAEPAGFAPTGRTMRIDGVDLWTFSGPRIARYRAFYDMTEVARQLGLAPAAGSRAERAAVLMQRVQARLRTGSG
jgi:steroid delta-isomerase-like uncharacterized protein